jgi:hypothetical protein
MTLNDEKKLLLSLLAESFVAIQKTLEGVDLEKRVYPDSDWRIRDVIGHLATWDRQVVKSLEAYRLGQEYALPDFDETEFNEREVLRHRALTATQVLEEWEQAREAFKQAVEEMPPDLFSGDLRYPWGDRGSIAHMVKDMTQHDAEHRAEILQAGE